MVHLGKSYMNSSRLSSRATTLAGAIALTLCSGLAASSSISVQSNATIARLFAAGLLSQTVLTRSSAHDFARYTVVLKDSPLASYQG